MTNIPNQRRSQSEISIHRLADMADADALLPGLDAVFFAASGTQTFENDVARAAFRERWLGRFLSQDRQLAYVALQDTPGELIRGPTVVGYLVGALDDPAVAPRFADLEFFQTFKMHTKNFPAQLHVNLAEQVRGQGHGGRLIEAFVSDARQQEAQGVHVVTGAAARNVAFYNRCGFEEVARTNWNDNTIVFLGRHL